MDFNSTFLNLNFLLALAAIILLITSEMLSSRYGKTNFTINKKWLDNITIAIFVFFMITVAIRIMNLIFSI